MAQVHLDELFRVIRPIRVIRDSDVPLQRVDGLKTVGQALADRGLEGHVAGAQDGETDVAIVEVRAMCRFQAILTAMAKPMSP